MTPSSPSSTVSAGPSSAVQAGTTTATALWLVRHGESTWNTAGLAQGHNDQAELTGRGLRQAMEAAERLRGTRAEVRAIYASDLRRARQTAAAFGKVLGLPVRADPRLRERSLGVLEGTPSAAIGPAVTGLGDGRVLDPDARPFRGESVRDLYQRAAAFCDALAATLRGTGRPHDDHGTRDGHGASAGRIGDVVIVAHGGTVRVLDAYLRGVSVEQMTWGPVENATVLRIPDFGTRASRGGNR